MSSTRRNLLLCVRNDGYEASLERRKIYQALPDRDAAKHRQVRVIDESGEDYLYPATFFTPIKPPNKGMDTMAKKTVRLRTDSIERLPEDKPVVYKIKDREGENIYTGVAGKGNVQSRLKDHLPGHRGAIPGAMKVQIDRQSSIREAERKESHIISRSRPKYNQHGK